ncbi:MAG: PAS domain-containing protein [Alphaproteobacteria bacterium]|nr:PAS domain-containing protein [Alphaproteobacteria bacterium]
MAGWLLGSLALAGLGAWLVRVMRARGALESRYHTLFDSIPYPVIVSNRKTRRILALNEAAVRQYGWSRDEIVAGAMTTDIAYLP